MDFLELVRQNRSYRGFDESRAVSRDELLRMVECARYSPSAANRQPLKYFLSSGADTNRVIQPLTAWAAKLRPGRVLPEPGRAPTAFIVICVDTRVQPNPASAEKDVGIAAQSILLCAASMGLGGCMIGAFRPEIKEALGLSEALHPSLVIGLGKPCERVVLEEAGESIDYYRDEDDVHHVPKRPMKEIIVS